MRYKLTCGKEEFQNFPGVKLPDPLTRGGDPEKKYESHKEILDPPMFTPK
jgi:hypothetical protein